MIHAIIVTRKNLLFILIAFSIIGFVFSDYPAIFTRLFNKTVSRIAYIRSTNNLSPAKILRNLEAAAVANEKQEREHASDSVISSVYNPIDQMTLVYIPAGEFLMGSSQYDGNHYEDEEPQHVVFLNTFWIDKTEITNEKFALCVEAGACAYSVSLQRNPRFLDAAYAQHPVVYISWYMAQTYCRWSGGRLPTEAEWQKAARGPYAAKYPWGFDEPIVNLYLANINNIIGDTTPVGLFISGASYYGVLDMGGNVREWVSDWYDDTYYRNSPYSNPQGPENGEKKVLMGASYQDPVDYARAANRLAHEPQSPGAVRGFRCVYSNASTHRTTLKYDEGD